MDDKNGLYARCGDFLYPPQKPAADRLFPLTENRRPLSGPGEKLRELDKDRGNSMVMSLMASYQKRKRRIKGVIISTAELEKYFGKGGYSRQNGRSRS